MATVPTFLLALALGASLYGPVVLGFGARAGRADLLKQGRLAAGLAAGALTLAAAFLVYYLGVSDFRLAYVADHTSRAIPLAYKIAAFWAGQEGSFLLWSLVLAWYAAYAATVTWRRSPDLTARAVAVMLGVNAFFLILLVFRANPFRLVSPVPEDGVGLNPLLQNFGMLAHPLTLYLGYVGFTVPFAFALAYLLGRDKGGKARTRRVPPAAGAPGPTGTTGAPGWLALTRSFTLFSWLFLSVGIVLGMQWAYVELGWGGYWGWDPVENASLVPWLTATAFLHSALVQERKGNLAAWNVLLVSLTFLLTVLGTFLTRTGIVSSVHAFTESGLEAYFLPFMLLVAGVTTWAVARGWPRLRDAKPLESLLSREAAVVLAVFLFGAVALVVLWGTLFPLVSKVLGGREVSVGPSYYLRSAVPIGGATVALLAVCQALGWSKTKAAALVRFLAPVAGLALAGAVGLALLFRPSVLTPGAVAGFAAAFLALFSTLGLVGRDARARRASSAEGVARAVASLFEINPRRYGALLVHLAIACMVAGFTGTAFREEKTFTLQPDQTVALAGYDLAYRGLGASHLPYRVSVAARVEATRGSRVSLLLPEKQYYANYESGFSEVAVLGGLKEDLYVILDSWSPDGSVSLRVLREPLVAWIWIGGYLLAVGTLVLAWPRRAGPGRPKPGVGERRG